MHQLKLADILNRSVVTVSSGCSIQQAFSEMLEQRASSAIVTRADQPIGILTERDAVAAADRYSHFSGLIVDQIMSSPLLTINQNTGFQEGYQFISEKAIRHLVVVNDQGALVGMVSEQDFLAHLGTEFLLRFKDVGSLMSTTACTIGHNSSARDAIQLMRKRGLSCVIIQQDNCPSGIFSERDVLKLKPDAKAIDQIPITEVMSSPVIGISPASDVREAIALMERNNIRQLAVVDETSSLRGVITQHEITRQIYDLQVRQLREALVNREQELDELNSALAIERDLRKSIEALRTSEIHLQLALEAGSVGTWDWDIKNDLFYADRQLARLFGIDQDASIAGTPLATVMRIIHQEDRDFFDHRIQLGFQTGRYSARYRIMVAGSVHWVNARGEVRYNDRGEPIQLHGALSDVTEQIVTENELQRNKEALAESEHRFQTIFEQAAVGVALIDSNSGCLVRINKRYCDMLGRSIEEMENTRLLQEITHPDDRPSNRDNMQRLINGDVENFAMEQRYLHKNGETIWVNLTVSPTWMGGETPSYHIAVVEDISERRSAIQELKESERRLSTLLSNLPGMVYRCINDQQWSMQFVSSGCLKLTGYQADALLHNRDLAYAELVHPDDLQKLIATIDQALSRNEAFTTVYRIINRDGETRWVWEQGQRVDAQNGEDMLEGFITDITQRKQAQTELQISHKKLLEAEHIAHMGSWELDISTLSAHWSDEVFNILGREPSPSVGPEFLSRIVHRDDWPAVLASLTSAMKQGTTHEMEYRILRPDGSEKWVYCKAERRLNSSGVPEKLYGIFQDISQRKLQEDHLRLSAKVFENTSEGVVITDPQGAIVDVNNAFTSILGYQRDEVIGKNPRILKSDRQDESFYRNLWASLLQTGQWRGELWNRRKDGSVYPEWLNISSVTNDRNELTHYVGVFTDITQMKQSQEKLDFLAHHDSLTGLPNRLLLTERLSHAIERAERHRNKIALLYFDLDNFKSINDSFGHPVGDALLQMVAERLLRILRHGDTVARIGGDEFVLLLEDIDTDDDMIIAAEKIIAEFSSPFLLEGQDSHITASIGICLYPQDGADSATLMRNADSAMYRAKEDGRNNYQFYTQELTRNAFERVFLENGLREAISQQQFLLHYQPQFNLNENTITGLEALIRWQHPQLGMISPLKFIPLAEDSGLIHPIGEWVMLSACKQARIWQDQALPFGRVSVNIAGPQIQRGKLVELVSDVLSETGLQASRLELEVTEGFIMDQPENAIDQLNALRDLGVSIAIDDFGTGYSSLTYLKKLPIQKLKIDQGFVRDIPDDKNDMAISNAVIALGNSLEMTVIAEGIETQQQKDFLLQSGCQQGQGYLYSKPLSAAAASDFIRLNAVKTV